MEKEAIETVPVAEELRGSEGLGAAECCGS